ncbi:MAG: leucine--tRNA ligase [Candidatus Bathyarchaeia archaeon]
MIVNWKKLEAKWQRSWETAQLYEAKPDPEKEKFFITVAYPYPNSPQHVGHGRTFTITDVYARYKRMRGFNVLFPMAFHYTGTPILAMAKRVASGDRELIDGFINTYHVPRETVQGFTEPIKIASYFHQEIKRGMKEVGYSIDWRREFTTIEAHYSRFIEWQFNTLKRKGLITRGSHPVGWCPSCENPMGQHDTKGDVEPDIGEFTLIKFRLVGAKDVYLPTGTLRPETLFGVTNLWIRPDVEYVQIEVEGETWVVSEECAEKLVTLNYEITERKKTSGQDFVGQYVENPLTFGKVMILPASFVDPKNATGVVMSVPGHAPYDYIALKDLKKTPENLAAYNIQPATVQDIEPISLITLEGYSEFPALDVLTRIGVTDQTDAKVEEATKEVYNKEFHMGIMKENTGTYAGLLVSDARNLVEKDLLEQGKACKMYELLNGPVYCRCGAEVLVKIFEDQWFLNYGDNQWKKLAHDCLNHMTIVPHDLTVEFQNVIDWLHEKACARKHGLGTQLPWDSEWIIESLSDSVIYMGYYTITGTIKKRKILSEQLSDEAFDYVFLGIGDPEAIEGKNGLMRGVLKEMRSEFTYFYPLDSRNSGRDLVPNHLTFFIFNHAAIFSRSLWPRQIVVNGSVLMEGKKMSKSFGNIIPLRKAIEVFGADPFRIAIVASSELLQDTDFSQTLAKAIKERLERFYAFSLKVIEAVNDESGEDAEAIDRWMVSRLQQHIETVTQAMENFKFRQAVQTALYIIDQDIQWYLKRAFRVKGRRSTVHKILRQVLETRVHLLAPFAPHLCEEIWRRMGNPDFISMEEWPRGDEAQIDASVLAGEETVKMLQGDISNIIQATKMSPQRICLYTASDWKWKVYRKALELAEDGSLEVGNLMKNLMTEQTFRSNAKQVSAFALKIVVEMKKSSPKILKKHLQIGYFDEFKAITDAKDYYTRELKAQIDCYKEDDEDIYNPKNRAGLAKPYRPAIYIE